MSAYLRWMCNVRYEEGDFASAVYQVNEPSISVSYLKTTKTQLMGIGGNALLLRYLSQYLMGYDRQVFWCGEWS